MRVLAFDPGMVRMGWASVLREEGVLHYHLSGVLHSTNTKPFQARRLTYIRDLTGYISTIFDLCQPDYVVNEIVPPLGYGGIDMYLANVAITVVQTYAYQQGLEVQQIGARTVQSKIHPGQKTTKVRVRNGVIKLFPELEERKKDWIKEFEEPDAIAIGAVELGASN